MLFFAVSVRGFYPYFGKTEIQGNKVKISDLRTCTKKSKNMKIAFNLFCCLLQNKKCFKLNPRDL